MKTSSSSSQWINTLVKFGGLSPARAAELKSIDETVHYALLEIQRQLGISANTGADATLWSSLRCVAYSRHNLYLVPSALPSPVMGGVRWTYHCSDCSTQRFTVVDRFGDNIRHEYHHSDLYTRVREQIVKAEANKLLVARQWNDSLKALVGQISNQGSGATTHLKLVGRS